jgi:CRISPR/Cas system CSM-associated protein Csm3 (group 7 of RAMP superfamily)
MAREIVSRIRVTGTLIAESPIHVGGSGGDPLVDMVLAINGQGNYYIPGTSLAGVLRAWIEQQDSQIGDQIWGTRQISGENGFASFVLVEDASVQGDVQTEIRDGVGIDRFSGSAAEYIKFDRMILPKGTTIDFQMMLERPKKLGNKHLDDVTWEKVRSLHGALLNALQSGDFRLGAAKTRGLGCIKLQDTTIYEQILNTPAGMLARLRSGGTPASLETVLPSSENIQRSQLAITIHWQPVGPLMVKAEQAGIAVDMLPLVSAVGDQLAFVLPGSSLKGTLRSQAERIVRTLLSQKIPSQADSKPQFLDQLDVHLVRELFGSAAKTNPSQGRMGALFVEDCYANHTMPSAAWNAIESAANQAELQTGLNQAGLKDTQQAFHVAIDRWTGGAADGCLYSTLEPMGINWQPIKLKLDLSRLKDLQSESIMLILLLLRDFIQGRVPLGYATNRGMGAIKVNNVVIDHSGLEEPLSHLSDIHIENDTLVLTPALKEHLEQSWRSWIATKPEVSEA